MSTITYADYFDRVWGCWLGKCISGTIGAPYEGMKQLLDIQFHPDMLRNMLPNDDLDLQLLWLDVLEARGAGVTSDDLAEAFAHRCPYAPGEYAVFKRNYRRGIHPPTSGAFNNRYYLEGMGSPIRSEVWACVAPGNPALAADLAERDAVMDHAGSSVYAERFFAAVESAAFCESDLATLYHVGLEQVPSGSRIDNLIRDVLDWCAARPDWRYVRSRIIREYGHPDCTNLFQNVGITLLALEYGERDFLKTTMLALNCGFDTDCTCATAGALLGILLGAGSLRQAGFEDQEYKVGVQSRPRSPWVRDLATDTCRVGVHIARTANRALAITGAETIAPLEVAPRPRVLLAVDYAGLPAAAPGDTVDMVLCLTARDGARVHGTLAIEGPSGWRVDSAGPAPVEVRKTATWPFRAQVPADLQHLEEANLFTATFTPDGDTPIIYRFGVAGAAPWLVFGPFWENVVEVPPLRPGEHYGAYIGGASHDDTLDRLRTYHLNTVASLRHEYMSRADLLDPPAAPLDAAREGRYFYAYEDRIDLTALVGFQGPCVLYAVRRFLSPDERKVMLAIGHSDAFTLWLNGNEVAARDDIDWWTNENVHVSDVPLVEGENVLVARLVRRTGQGWFSVAFLSEGICSEPYSDLTAVCGPPRRC